MFFSGYSLCRVFQLLLAGALIAACAGDAPRVFEDAHGNSLDLADYQGRWVLINYWATWCAPCREEIPALNRFAEQHADTVAVIGVGLDGQREERLRAEIAELGIRFPVLAEDPGPVLGLTFPTVVPTTWLLDPDGKLVKALLGPQDDASLAAAIGLE